MVITVTVNPAIDDTILADRIAFEDRGYILSRGQSAGGRGLNASLVLHSFGVDTLAIVTCGGETGRIFEASVARLGIRYEAVGIEQSLRSNLIITDRQGLTVKLNEPGPRITEEELERLEAVIRKHLPQAKWLLLCGSLPPGAPAEFYQRLVKAAREVGVPTLLDIDGDVLQFALEYKPTVVTPNQHEASQLINKAIVTRQHFRSAVQRILAMGAESVILSLGSRGAFAATQNEIVEIVPPRVDAVSPIGAGDALNAAFVWARVNGHDFVTAAKWGVAAGTASARLPGMRFADLEQTREIFAQMEVR